VAVGLASDLIKPCKKIPPCIIIKATANTKANTMPATASSSAYEKLSNPSRIIDLSFLAVPPLLKPKSINDRIVLVELEQLIPFDDRFVIREPLHLEQSLFTLRRTTELVFASGRSDHQAFIPICNSLSFLFD